MPYFYKQITLEGIDATGANLRPVKSYIPGPVAPVRNFSMGEKVRMTVTVEKTAPSVPRFRDGQTFGFNVKLFADQIHSLAPAGTGWRIQIRQGSGGLLGKATLDTGGREAIDRNIDIVSVTFQNGNTEMVIVFDFYITSDVTDWIGFNQIAEQLNINRWTRTNRGSETDLDNSQQSAFKRVDNWIEVAMWEADKDLNPLTVQGASPQDPIVRYSPDPDKETFALQVGLKYYDEVPGAVNQWNTTTAKDDNWLKSLTITAGNLETITQVDHKGFPYDYEFTLSNFIFDTPDPTTNLVVNEKTATTGEKNNVQIVIGSPNLPDYTNVEVHLIRVDAPSELNDFTKTYQLISANIPKLQPAVTVINGPFETPSAWAVAAGELTIDFILNGAGLEAGAEYHLITVLTKNDGGDDFSSSHITPSLSVSYALINAPTVSGLIETHNNVFGPTINDVTLSNFERVKLGILVDTNAYGVADFANDFVGVRLVSDLNGDTTSLSTSAAGIPSGPPPSIEIIDLGGGILEMSVVIRSYYAVGTTTQSTHRWELVFQPSGFNQPQDVVFSFEQRLRHSPNDLVRLPSMRFLDASVFPGTLAEKFYICENIDEEIVIEVEKNGAPNANLQALILQSGPDIQTPTILPAIEEEEAYAGNLTQLSSTSITQVDVDFAAQLNPDFAYYTVKVADLSAIKVLHAIAINI